jgi:hypothetical protein
MLYELELVCIRMNSWLFHFNSTRSWIEMAQHESCGVPAIRLGWHRVCIQRRDDYGTVSVMMMWFPTQKWRCERDVLVHTKAKKSLSWLNNS